MNDIRRKQRSNSHDGSNDYTDRGTAEYHGRDASGDTGKDEKLMCFQEQEERLQQLEKELSELLQILPDTEELLMLLEERQTRYRNSQTKISNGRNWHRN